MRTCYHAPCDTYELENEEKINWEFYLQTTQALIDTVVQLSNSTCKSKKKFGLLEDSTGFIFMMRDNGHSEMIVKNTEDDQKKT